MMSRMMPRLHPPVQRTGSGKPSLLGASEVPTQGEVEGVSPSTVDFMGLPFANDAAVAPSFIFPPLPFADDGAE